MDTLLSIGGGATLRWWYAGAGPSNASRFTMLRRSIQRNGKESLSVFPAMICDCAFSVNQFIGRNLVDDKEITAELKRRIPAPAELLRESSDVEPRQIDQWLRSSVKLAGHSNAATIQNSVHLLTHSTRRYHNNLSIGSWGCESLCTLLSCCGVRS